MPSIVFCMVDKEFISTLSFSCFSHWWSYWSIVLKSLVKQTPVSIVSFLFYFYLLNTWHLFISFSFFFAVLLCYEDVNKPTLVQQWWLVTTHVHVCVADFYSLSTRSAYNVLIAPALQIEEICPVSHVVGLNEKLCDCKMSF